MGMICNNPISQEWHCKEFNHRIWIEIKKEKESDIFILHSFLIEKEFSTFDFRNCAFIDEKGKAFFPELDEKHFLTNDCVWYIEPPKNFYIYSDRKNKYKWEKYLTKFHSDFDDIGKENEGLTQEKS